MNGECGVCPPSYCRKAVIADVPEPEKLRPHIPAHHGGIGSHFVSSRSPARSAALPAKQCPKHASYGMPAERNAVSEKKNAIIFYRPSYAPPPRS